MGASWAAALTGLSAAIAVGGCAYFVLALVATHRFAVRRQARRTTLDAGLSFSVLKPLAGPEPDLEENLRGFFRLDHPRYEVLFAARDAEDPALQLAASLAARHPAVRSQVLAVGEPSCPNAKVHALTQMTAAATGEILVISDSDIRTGPELLRALEAEFSDPVEGVVTCPYRAMAGPSLWSRLEALGMNGEMWLGVLVAQHLAPMDFAVGPTMAVRRECLEAVGGWRAVEEHLAEDFQIGRLATRAGYKARLGGFVVEHRIGSQGWAENLAHRLRWCRSTRRSRPLGYWGQVFANPLPWALVPPLLMPVAAWPWLLLVGCGVLRAIVLDAVGRRILRADAPLRRAWLVPLQDSLSLALWIAGFFGRHVVWRGRTYRVSRDGRLQPRGREIPQTRASTGS